MADVRADNESSHGTLFFSFSPFSPHQILSAAQRVIGVVERVGQLVHAVVGLAVSIETHSYGRTVGRGEKKKRPESDSVNKQFIPGGQKKNKKRAPLSLFNFKTNTFCCCFAQCELKWLKIKHVR